MTFLRLFLALMALGLARPAQAQTCADAIAALRSALPSAPLAEVARIHRSQVETTCLGAQVGAAAYAVALRHVRDEAGLATPQQRLAMLREGQRFSRQPWQLYAALGDALQAIGSFAEATREYQLGMNAMRDLPSGQPEPSREAKLDLTRKAEGTHRLAEGRSIEMPRTRDGSAGGLGMPELRGTDVHAVPVPINFPDDSDIPTREGYDAVRALLELLRERGSPAITLVGHADRRGSHAYNDDLSLRRARRVAQLLAQAGYAGSIQVEGRGKREPFEMPVVPDVTYSDDQRNALDRRVELRR